MILQDLFNRLGSGNLSVDSGFPNLDADVRSNYIMNTTLLGVEKADAILLIGSNPRTEAPVFNARQGSLCMMCLASSLQNSSNSRTRTPHHTVLLCSRHWCCETWKCQSCMALALHGISSQQLLQTGICRIAACKGLLLSKYGRAYSVAVCHHLHCSLQCFVGILPAEQSYGST